MPITISNTSLVIDGSKATWTVPSPVLFTGEIVRLFNSSSTTQTYDYVGIDGITATATVAATTSSYILVKSGSANDFYSDSNFIAAIKLNITGSELGNPFTEQLITATGAGTWTKPTGVTEVIVECWAGGGAGGGCTSVNSGGGGGAGGQYARKFIRYASPSQGISYSIGIGGTGGTGNGGVGEDTTWNTTEVVAKGGAGGTANTGEGGIATVSGGVGDFVYITDKTIGGETPFSSGNSGGYTPPPADLAAGGSGGIGGSSTSYYTSIANAGVEYGGSSGNGGSAVAAGGANGLPGNNYAAGGGGAAKISGANRTGGNGAQGLIRILYR